MFRTEPWPAGTPCWTDCAFHPEHRGMHHARDFYGKLFGWDLDEGPEEYGGYVMALKDDTAAAALAPTTDDEQDSSWVVYIATDDVEASARAVQSAGGQVVAGPTEIPGSGDAAFCTDPQGAVFALWQAGEHIGYGIAGEPGTVGWHTLRTTDVDAARQFYGAVFGWTFDADPRIAELADGTPVAAIEPLDGELAVEPSWTPHFQVADRDSTAQIAQELGGHILSTSTSQFGQEGWLEGPSGERFEIVSIDGE